MKHYVMKKKRNEIVNTYSDYIKTNKNSIVNIINLQNS